MATKTSSSASLLSAPMHLPTPPSAANNNRVVVAMSGGVDSSLAAALLKERGYDVIGLFMKNWKENSDQGECSAAQDFRDVEAVCQRLDIPYYSVQFYEEYWDKVFATFLEELQQGYTPNPDILCNKEIKFNLLFKKARSLGASFLATGHYCRIAMQDVEPMLQKGADRDKDQSYFLYTLPSALLTSLQFPVGHLSKTQVRRMAEERGLPTAHKKDSTGICFIGKKRFKPFISRYVAYSPGEIYSVEGTYLGQHAGIAFYTIGQRKGLEIGRQGAAWFVVGKDLQRNRLIVAQGARRPALYHKKLIAKEVTWVNKPPPSLPFSCTAKIRYRQLEQECTIEKEEGGLLHVSFLDFQRAITPRQSIVFYQQDLCLGGGLIETALDPLF